MGKLESNTSIYIDIHIKTESEMEDNQSQELKLFKHCELYSSMEITKYANIRTLQKIHVTVSRFYFE